jgi:hypothetical protein
MASRRRKRHGRGNSTLPALYSLTDGPPEIQRMTGKVFKASWRDPTDEDPNRRTAREVHRLPACLPLEVVPQAAWPAVLV